MNERRDKVPQLCIVAPCFNEEDVLPVCVPDFVNEIGRLKAIGKISEGSFLLLVDDGSKDGTWDIIKDASERYDCVKGLSLSRNRGQQNALMAGLMEEGIRCDIAVTTDCDGQNELGAIERMIDKYNHGFDVVYGVRADRKSDGFFKKHSAQVFYRLMSAMGVEMVYNHADYRLVSRRVLEALDGYHEVNLFLRGLLPLVGFRSTEIEYSMDKRRAGETKYTTGRMCSFAIDGVTSFSIKPLRVFSIIGLIVSVCSLIGIIWTIIDYALGNTVSGYASLMCVICFMAGIQLLGIGTLGEYIGKIYMEVKHRPRYIIAERTDNHGENQ